MKSRIALFCAAVFGAMVLVGCAPKASTAYDVARNMDDAKQYKEAIAKYEEYVKANPTSALVPYALYFEAVCHKNLYDKQSAMDAYKKVLDQYPQTDPGQWAKVDRELLESITLVAPPTTTTTTKPKPTTTTTTMKPKPTTTTTTMKPKPTTTTTVKAAATTTTTLKAAPVTTTTVKAAEPTTTTTVKAAPATPAPAVVPVPK